MVFAGSSAWAADAAISIADTIGAHSARASPRRFMELSPVVRRSPPPLTGTLQMPARRLSRSIGSNRNRALDHVAVHDAPVSVHRVIGDGAVQQAAVVPHHEIAEAPAMRMDKRRLRRLLQQRLEESGTLFFRHSDDAYRVVSEIERRSASIGVGAHQRVVDRRQLVSVITGPATGPPLKEDAA